MILRVLRVENWRCFANPIEVGPLSERINVLHGPNGIGKSTLLGSLVRGFFDNHGVSGKDIEALRPWGRRLSPTVTIEFEDQNRRYRVMKRFLNSPACELSRWEDGRFVRLAEGEAADGLLREMLSGTAPGRGLSDERHWGMAQVLWALQEKMAMPEPAVEVSQAIRVSLGSQVADQATAALEEKVKAEYAAIYTSTGKFKSGKEAPEIVRLEAELAEARKSLPAITEKAQAFDQAGRRIQELQSRRQEALHKEKTLAAQLDAARKRAQLYAGLIAARDKQQASLRAAEARHAEIQQRIGNIKHAQQELEDARGELQRLQVGAPLQGKDLGEQRAAAETAKAGLDKIRLDRVKVDVALREAESARRFIDHRAALAAGRDLIERITAVQKELGELNMQRSKQPAPDAATLMSIRNAVRDRDNARVKLEAAMISVTVTAENSVQLEVLRAEQTGVRALVQGETVQLKGSPEVAIRLPGVAEIRATGPAGSVEQLRNCVDATQQHFDALIAGYGTSDLDELQLLHDQANRLNGEISNASVRLETLLSGRKKQVIQEECGRAERSVQALLAEYPQWAQSPPDPFVLSTEAEQLKNDFVRKVEAAESEWSKANKAYTAAAEKMASYQADLNNAERRITAATRRLKDFDSDGLDNAQRAEALQKVTLEWDAAKASLEQVENQLQQFPTNPSREVENLQNQQEALQAESAAALAGLSRTEGQLEELISEAPYSALAQVEETIARLEESAGAERLRTSAIRLLHETIQTCKKAAVEAVVEPVEARATQTLLRIAGNSLGTVKFKDNFLLEALNSEVAGKRVVIEELSGGEREQVHFAVRLALADVLFKDQRQLVVLDDVFTFTDAARFARVLGILEEAAERFQVLILSCHPDRYRGLQGADFFDLENIRSTAKSL
jgi:DNA repair exonuclease SbcCD ATPase subunit